jgi:hypothetical protein
MSLLPVIENDLFLAWAAFCGGISTARPIHMLPRTTSLGGMIFNAVLQKPEKAEGIQSLIDSPGRLHSQ